LITFAAGVDSALLTTALEYAEYTTADNNVLRRRWLPVYLDPARPAGISSSDGEHAAAIQRARTIADDMAGEWERPIIADSGNGAHLLYRIDLANDQEALAFVMGALAELDRRYSDDLVKVDLTCANAARIWKAYGTVARKGDSIPGRPPRVDSDPRVGFDMDGYLARHYLAVTRHKPWTSQPGGLIYELNHCPFDAAHVNGSAAFTLVGENQDFDASTTAVVARQFRTCSPYTQRIRF
jgi:hypothetical protein